jgi:predicted nucleic acid-binding protein
MLPILCGVSMRIGDEASGPPLLYLDQNYVSGLVKGKPGFRELEPVLRAAVERGAVAVPEAEAHRVESAARPDLPLLRLVRELSAGLELPASRRSRAVLARLHAELERHPGRHPQTSDAVDLRALAAALPVCRLVTCDAFMADLVRRTGLDVLLRCELYTGRRRDVDRLRERLHTL